MSEPASLGDMIRERRVARGWSQPELAAKLSVSQQTLSRWENGSATPRVAKLQNLATVLEVPLADLKTLVAAVPRDVSQEAPPLQAILPFGQLSEVQFEQFTAALLQELHPDATVYRNGDRGHKQHGIDVFVEHPDGSLDGVQCKKVQEFGKAKVRKAIDEFDPATGVTEPAIFLSRSVSPGARKEVDDNPPWSIKGSEELSRDVTLLDLDRQLRLIRRFFPALRESFLGVRNPSPWLSTEEFRLPLDREDGLFRQTWNLVGRESELDSIDTAFAEGKSLVVVEAPAGKGKTRLVLGLADRIEESRGARIRFLSADQEVGPSDYEALPKGNLMLVIDDAHRRTDLAAIIRNVMLVCPEARFVLTTRSHCRHDIDEQLRLVGKSIREGENLFALGSLTFEQSWALALQVVSPTRVQPQTLEALAELGTDSPFFVVVGGQLLMQNRIETPVLESSPVLRSEILKAFREALVGDDSEVRSEVLRAVAAMQPFRSDWETFQESIENLVGKKYRLLTPVLRELEEAGLLLRRGPSYRIVPDLLGDIILSQALVHEDSGAPTSYATELIEALSDDALKHALVNVGRVDFQIQMGGQTRGTVLDDLWDLFRAEFEAADAERRIQLVDVLKEVAYYQPDRSLAIARWLLEHPIIGPPRREELAVLPAPVSANDSVERVLVDVLERTAYHERDVAPSMELLRRLIKGPLGVVGVPDDPAAAALRKLMNFRYPLQFIGTALKLVLTWLANGASTDEERVVLLEVIRPVLATESMDTRSDGAAIHMNSTLVRAEPVRPFRRLVVAQALRELASSTRSSTVQIAAKLLEDALRWPVGLLGANVSDEDRNQWEPDHLELLDQLRSRLGSGVSKAEAGAFRKAIRWHVQYGSGIVAEKAREIWELLPSDQESNVALALRDQSPVIGGHDIETDMRKSRDWQQQVAQHLLDSHKGDSALDVIEAELTSNAELGWEGDPHPFASALFDLRPELASSLLDRVTSFPDAKVSVLTTLALTVELDHRPGECAARFDAVLDGEDPAFRQRAAQAIAWSARQGLAKVPGGRNRIIQLLNDPDDGVARQGLWAIRVLPESDSTAVRGFAEHMDMSRTQLASEVAALFGAHGPLKWADLNPAVAALVLEGLVGLADIDDFQIQQLLKEAAQLTPQAVIELLERRIERQDSEFRTSGYRALTAAELRPFDLPNGPLKDALMEQIWEWMCREPSWFRLQDGAKLWWSIAIRPDQDVLNFLMAKTELPHTNYAVMGAILAGLPRRFVVTTPDYVAQILEAAQRQGDEPRKHVASGLYGSVMYGVRSRAIGIPDPQDLNFRDQFARIAEQQPPGPARHFYTGMSAAMEREIHYHTDDDADLLDRRKW